VRAAPAEVPAGAAVEGADGTDDVVDAAVDVTVDVV
jgi:hypothetical protein